MHYYLSPWTGDGSALLPFRPTIAAQAAVEGIAWSAIDLRPDPANVAGRALVACAARPSIETGTRYLGEDPGARLSNAILTRIGNDLGLSLTATDLRRVAVELLIDHAREDGTRWRPLRPLGHGPNAWELHLGGLLWAVPRLAGGAIYSESFNKPDASTLGPDLTWAHVSGEAWTVVSNQAVPNLSSLERAEHDTASSDQYGEVTVASRASGGVNRAGAMVRFSSSAETCYGSIHNNGGEIFLVKHVAATVTEITSRVQVGATTPMLLRTEVSGSTVRGFAAGTQHVTATDTSITSGTRAGLFGHRPSSRQLVLDNFTFGDLGGGGVARDLTGASPAAAAANGSASIARRLAGSASAAAGGSGVLARTRALSASASAANSAAGALARARPLSGSAGTAGSASGALTVTRALSGSASASGGASAALGAARSVSGSASAAGHASGSLGVARALSGAAGAASGAVGELSTGGDVSLSATASAASGASGSLTVARPLTGVATAANGAAGALHADRALSATGSAASGAMGDLSTGSTTDLTGTAAAASSAVGAVAASRPLTAAAAAAAAAAGQLTVLRALTGSAPAAASASGALAGSDDGEFVCQNLAGAVQLEVFGGALLVAAHGGTVAVETHAGTVLVEGYGGTAVVCGR